MIKETQYIFRCESCGRKCRKTHSMLSAGNGIGLSVCGRCIKHLMQAGWHHNLIVDMESKIKELFHDSYKTAVFFRDFAKRRAQR